MDLYDAASFHSLVLRTENRSPRTMANYLSYERRLIAFLESRGQPATLDALNPVTIRQALVWLQKQPTGRRGGESARAQFVSVMKVWSTFLAREGVVPADPLDRLTAPNVRAIERIPYARSEVLALLAASARHGRLAARDTLLVQLLLNTGARVSEVTGLTTDRLRLLRDDTSVTVLGKGNRERTIPIGDPRVPDGGELVRLLRAYLREREAFFLKRPRRRTDRLLLTHNGFALTSKGARTILQKLGAEAGVGNVIPHRFRHTFASIYLTTYPGDETGLRRLLGHLSDSVLRSYTHLAEATIAERAGKAAPMAQWLRVAR